jgi:hypothetical protein
MTKKERGCEGVKTTKLSTRDKNLIITVTPKVPKLHDMHCSTLVLCVSNDDIMCLLRLVLSRGFSTSTAFLTEVSPQSGGCGRCLGYLHLVPLLFSLPYSCS